LANLPTGRKSNKAGSSTERRKDSRRKPALLQLNELPFSHKRVEEFYCALCSAIDSTVSNKALELLREGKYLELINLTVDPNDYKDSHWQSFALDYAVVSFWKKYPDFPIAEIDKEQAAFDKWLAGEESNAKINELFRSRWEGVSLFPFHVEEVLYLARQKVREVLGNFDRMAFADNCRFGPGADLGTVGGNTSGYHKYRTSGHSTPAAASVLEEYFNNDVRRCFSNECKLVRASRLSFVPKNAKTYRAIEVGPRWNVYLQLGLGELLSSRLRSVGLDIKSQADVNRKMVSRAHSDGLATIDIANASGTIATNLVIDLLSGLEDGDEEGSFSEWLDLILKLRVTHTEYKDRSFRLEMISGMGNGYTFPLETLIFYVLASGACQYLELGIGDIGVFGDDIILPKEAAPLLMEVLSAVGFTANKDKTFVEGEFFESCGHDYYRGRNVRPIFLKGKVDTLDKAYVLCNQVVAWGKRISYYAETCLRRIYLARYKLNGIQRAYRFFGPPCELNGVIHSSFDEYLPRRPKGGLEGGLVFGAYAVPKRYDGYSYQGHLYSKLSGGTLSRQAFNKRDDVEWRYKDMVLPLGDIVLSEEWPVGF